jgi:hypothetical protein
MLGSFIAPLPPPAHISQLSQLPSPQTPVASCCISSYQIETYFVRFETQALVSLWISVSGPTLHSGLRLPCPSVLGTEGFFCGCIDDPKEDPHLYSKELRGSCLLWGDRRGKDSVEKIQLNKIKLNIDDLPRSAFLWAEILSLYLESWEEFWHHLENKEWDKTRNMSATSD